VSTSVCHGQKLQNYQGTRSYPTPYLEVTGTEKYSFSIGNGGERLIQGKYTYSGDMEYRNEGVAKSTFTVSATCRDNEINGAFTSTGTHFAKTYYYRGTNNASTKFIGNFSNGKASGLFSIVVNSDNTGLLPCKGKATLKNGNFVGEYYYEDFPIKLSGQLTQEGKLTGKWTYYNGQTNTNNQYVFENDVAIIITNNETGTSTPPEVQQIAKQFAAGKLTKEQVKAKGLILKEESFQLDNIIGMILRNEITGLETFPGSWDVSGYEEKQYTEILKLNTISEEGLNLIINEIKKTKKPNVTYRNPNNESEACCSMLFDGYDAYYMRCSPEFNRLYGYYHESYSSDDDKYIYLTEEQHKRLTLIKDSILVKYYANDFKDALNKDFYYSFNGIYSESSKLPSLYASFRNHGTISLEQLPSEKGAVKAMYEKSKSTYNDFIENTRRLESRKELHFTPDSMYIIYKNEWAMKNELSIWKQFNEALLKVSLKSDSLAVIYDELKQQDTTKVSKLKYCIINKYFAQNKSSKDLKEAFNNINNIKSLLNVIDTVENRHNDIIVNIPDKSTKKYKGIYNQTCSTIENDNSKNFEQCEEMLVGIQNLQEKIIEYYTLKQNVKKQNDEITKKCSEKKYYDILKPCQKIFKKNTKITDNIDQNITSFKEVQNIEEKLIEYIQLRQHSDNLHTQILESAKKYTDVTRFFKAKVKSMAFVPDMSNVETLNRDYDVLKEYVSYQQELITYIQTRQEIDLVNKNIIEKIGKAKNVKKSYDMLYKSLPVTWTADTDNFNTIVGTLSLLRNVEQILTSNGAISCDVKLKNAKTAEDFKKVLGL
jgi:hypothetical protein